MMKKIYFIPPLLIFVFLSLTGCENQRTQLLNDNWGKSYQAVKTNHIINPDAGLDEQPMEGLDGIASMKAANKYHNSFDEKPPAQITNITISGVGGK
jgi:hypothetical protein